ncbi:MAG TPA: hypothetical protein DIW05_03230 [Syntrophaceae bacterium]|nr:hypothetical protein [Syntrophaceae bacterium]
MSSVLLQSTIGPSFNIIITVFSSIIIERSAATFPVIPENSLHKRSIGAEHLRGRHFGGVRISLTYKTVFHILDVKVKIQGI